jgi:hypothetical protein
MAKSNLTPNEMRDAIVNHIRVQRRENVVIPGKRNDITIITKTVRKELTDDQISMVFDTYKIRSNFKSMKKKEKVEWFESYLSSATAGIDEVCGLVRVFVYMLDDKAVKRVYKKVM